MALTSRSEEGVTILEWEGPLGVDNHAGFKDAVHALLDAKQSLFIFDLSQVNFIDSTGLGVMTALLRRSKQLGGDFILAGLQANVQSIFEITGLRKLFTIAPTVRDAKTRIGQ